jgi:hypothetical protein
MTLATEHAVLRIHNASKMTPSGRAIIANWLHTQADMLQRQGDEYAAHYRASYEGRHGAHLPEFTDTPK